LEALLTLFAGNPLTDKRDFLEKLNEQLTGASPAVPKLAAEVLWFLNLFPSRSVMKPETKREQIERVWGWSGEPAPGSVYLDEAHMHGVGNPGTAYATHRPMEFEYLLRTVIAFKKLPAPEQSHLLRDDPPWTFMRWLDEQEGSDRRLVRNTMLYFLFPDYTERNTSRSHKRQIYKALKGKLPQEKRIPSKNGSMLDLDRAIFEIRKVLEAEARHH
jgi:5-methylcytosine-specific restriction enzyme B